MNILLYTYPLFLTLLIETPIYFRFSGKKNALTLILLTMMNLISNLSFNFLYSFFNHSLVFLIYGEILVTFIEGAILYLIYDDVKRILLTILANGLSLAIGWLLNTYVVITKESLVVAALICETLFLIYFIFELINCIKRFKKIRLKTKEWLNLSIFKNHSNE